MDMEDEMELRNGGIYSCAAVCAWLQDRAGLNAGSAKWRRVLAGDDAVQVGPREFRFEPLKQGVPGHDVNQQFKAHSVDKAELDKFLDMLETVAPTRGLIRLLVGVKAAVWASAAALAMVAAEQFIVLPSIANILIVTAVGTIGGMRESRRSLGR